MQETLDWLVRVCDYIAQLIVALTIMTIDIYGLYILMTTDWFIVHKIWILTEFHWYIIFSGTFISCIYFLSEIASNVKILDHTVIIDSDQTESTKQEIVQALVSFYDLQVHEKDEDEDKDTLQPLITPDGIQVLIIYTNLSYIILTKPSWNTYFTEIQWTNKLGHFLLETIENQ